MTPWCPAGRGRNRFAGSAFSNVWKKAPETEYQFGFFRFGLKKGFCSGTISEILSALRGICENSRLSAHLFFANRRKLRN
jgi:hypothetical protein